MLAETKRKPCGKIRVLFYNLRGVGKESVLIGSQRFWKKAAKIYFPMHR